MAALNLNAITENASRLGLRLQETLSEHTRDLSIRGSGAAYLDNPEEKVKNIGKQLDSNSDREKLEAMKRLVALISKGRNVSEFFAQVVKNVASHNIEIRKLVYIYLLRYAEQEPDLALLSINTFQKDLSDPNPLIRAMALRVLSGIKVSMIGSIVMLAIKKCAADISPYVRKAAALAIPKLHHLDSSHQPELIKVISTLLKDQSPLSLGSVAIAFEAVCPTRLDLLHQHYRRLCRTLIDMDEWGQVDLLGLLIRYARMMLPRPLSAPSLEVDRDLHLLLTSAEPLFESHNPAVVLAVARVIYYLSPPSELQKIVPPLLRLLHGSPEVERVVLTNLVIISSLLSEELGKSYTRFLVRIDDSQQVKKDKMRLLRAVVSPETYPALLREFIAYADDPNDELVAYSIQAIGHIARTVPDSTQQCLTALMTFIQSKHDVVVTNAVLVLKSLVQIRLQQQQSAIAHGSLPSETFAPLEIISRLARRLDELRHPKARACVLWLVGQYAASPHSDGVEDLNGALYTGPEGIAPWAPDVLRKTAKSFAQETAAVKLQIITLAVKLLVLSPADRTIALLTSYVFSLARYDLNYDVRDRGRMLSALLSGVNKNLAGDNISYDGIGGVILRREQVKVILFDGKADLADEGKEVDDQARFGSLAAITGKWAGENVLPDWLEEGTESSLRDSEADVPQTSLYAPQSQSSAAIRAIGSSSRTPPVVLTPGGPSPSGSFTKQGLAKTAYIDLDEFYEDVDAADESVESKEDESEDEDEDEDEDEEGGSTEQQDSTESGSGSESEHEDEREEDERGNGTDRQVNK